MLDPRDPVQRTESWLAPAFRRQTWLFAWDRMWNGSIQNLWWIAFLAGLGFIAIGLWVVATAGSLGDAGKGVLAMTFGTAVFGYWLLGRRGKRADAFQGFALSRPRVFGTMGGLFFAGAGAWCLIQFAELQADHSGMAIRGAVGVVMAILFSAAAIAWKRLHLGKALGWAVAIPGLAVFVLALSIVFPRDAQTSPARSLAWALPIVGLFMLVMGARTLHSVAKGTFKPSFPGLNTPD
jgi:hypothetical protein